MATRYAVASGNWSNTATWNGGTLPAIGDSVYSNNFTVTIDQTISVVTISNVAAAPAVAGGSFIINDGVTITCSGGITGGAVQLLSYSGVTSVTINANLFGPSSANIGMFTISGSGTVRVNGNVALNNNMGNNNRTIYITNGVLNVLGSVSGTNGGVAKSGAIHIAGTCTVNVIGDIITTTATACAAFWIQGNVALNITGNVNSNTNQTGFHIESNCTITVTGNVSKTQPSNNVFVPNTAFQLIIIGNVSVTDAGYVINTNGVYIKVIGAISTTGSVPAIINSSLTAINIFSGPFICSQYGVFPFSVNRMHLIPSSSSYFEFRDDTTNGALSPGAIAPTTRLVSPATAVDAPAESDVRNLTYYALGTRRGTLKVPNPNQVSVGVAVDATVGTAALKPEDVWNHPLASIVTDNTIGKRLKNASTIESTGDQIAALIT